MNIKTLAWVFGVVLSLIGVLGFVPGITSNGHLLGIFQVDALHNIIHLASGLAALLLASMGKARLYFKAFGSIYALVAVVGLIQKTSVLGLIGVNLADNVLHILVAASALYIGFGMKAPAAPTMQQPMA